MKSKEQKVMEKEVDRAVAMVNKLSKLYSQIVKKG